ncbi:MAG: GNAT family N-acetyltransferase [Anaerolineae bacterium]|nr:GNAT family N-acetyltransferase [Anaerolineae bacterium]
MFTVRPAQAPDQIAIRQLIRASRLNPMGLNWANFLVAESDEGLFIGCGQIKTHQDGTRELASIAVIPAWRGRHVAATLIHELLRQSPRPLYLMCGSRLIPFYQKFGFQELTPPTPIPKPFRFFRRLVTLISRFSPGSDYLAVMRAED